MVFPPFFEWGEKPLNVFKVFGEVAVSTAAAQKEIDNISAEAQKIGAGFEAGQKASDKSMSEIAKESGKTSKQIQDDVEGIAKEYEKKGEDISSAMEESYEDIEDSAKKTHRTMEREMDETASKAKETGDEMESKMNKAFKKIGSAAVTCGKAIATGLAAGIAAFGALTVEALNAAGELEQNLGGASAVFGEFASDMEETAKSAFSSMGLSATEYLATANKMGSLFKGAGFEAAEAADLTATAMQRAADVASIMGIDISAAMESVAGAAKGNFTMMDNLGVAINDTNLQAYALAKGIEKSTQEMTTQEKIGLAMQMFLEKTADYAGNYAKENETLAGSLTTAKAALTNFLSGSGDAEQLVTSLSNAANIVVEKVGEIAPKLINGLMVAVNQALPMLPSLLGEMLPVIIDGAVSLINGVILALPSVLELLTNAILPQLLSGLVTIYESVIAALPTLIDTLSSALLGFAPLLIDAAVSLVVLLCSNFGQIIQPLASKMPEILTTIVSTLINNLPVLIDGLIQLALAVVETFPTLMLTIVDSVPLFYEMLFTELLNNLPTLISGLDVVIWELAKVLPELWLKTNPLYFVFQAFNGVFEALKNVLAPYSEYFEGIWDEICNAVKVAIDFIGSIISAAFQIITLPFCFIWENCKEYVFAAFEWISRQIMERINIIKMLVQIGFGLIRDRIITPIVEAKDKAVAVFGILKDKLLIVADSVKDKIASAFSAAKERMVSQISNAYEIIKSIVDRIKGIFSELGLEFPDIKMPHFKVSPSDWKIGDLLQGSIPKLDIEWYAKGGIMRQPTLFDYNPASGTARVGGEAGAEAIAPIETLQKYVKAAVQDENRTMVYLLEQMVKLFAEEKATSDRIEQLLSILADSFSGGVALKVNNREFGRMVRTVYE